MYQSRERGRIPPIENLRARAVGKGLESDDVIFCVSEATRAALASAFPSVGAKTKVLYQFVEWPGEFASFDRNLPALRLGSYAVVVGAIEPRKNLKLILNALSSREISRSDMRFIVIGRKGADGSLMSIQRAERLLECLCR